MVFLYSIRHLLNAIIFDVKHGNILYALYYANMIRYRIRARAKGRERWIGAGDDMPDWWKGK